MKRRDFLKRSIFGSAMLALPLPTFGQRDYQVDSDGKPEFPKSLETDHQSKVKAAMVTNARLRLMVLRWQAKETPGTDHVRTVWNETLLPMLRQEPAYFVAIRNHFGLDTKKGWIRREMEADYGQSS